MGASEAIETRIRQEIDKMHKRFDRLIGCAVVVDAPHNHSRKGGLYSIGIELRVPGAPPIHVGRPHHEDHSHEDVYVAIRDAFAAARRSLQDYGDKLRDERHSTGERE